MSVRRAPSVPLPITPISQKNKRVGLPLAIALAMTALLAVTLIVCVRVLNHNDPISSIQIRSLNISDYYAGYPDGRIFQFSAPEQIQELQCFFEGLEYQPLLNEEDSPDNTSYWGCSYDHISFYSGGELVSQCTIFSNRFIRLKPEGVWYALADESGVQWGSYVKDLRSELDQYGQST